MSRKALNQAAYRQRERDRWTELRATLQGIERRLQAIEDVVIQQVARPSRVTGVVMNPAMQALMARQAVPLPEDDPGDAA